MKLDFYRNFPSQEHVQAVTEILDEHDVPYEVLENTRENELVFLASGTVEMQFCLRARPEDFVRINELIDVEMEVSLNEVEEDHYLRSFSSDELIEVVMKPEEWSVFDFKVAGLLLNERGVEVSEEFLNTVRAKGHKAMYNKETYPTIWIVLGYVSAFLGGLLGIAIGLSLVFMTKKLPNGDIIHRFTEAQRKQGKFIVALGFIMLIAYTLLRAFYV